MPGIPQRLEDWSLDVVRELVSKGYFETDLFDFKEVLIASPNTDGYRNRLTRTACAFANSGGGFLVFGVKDAQAASSVEERLVGIPNSSELAKQFGDVISTAERTLNFVPQNPPIELPNSQKVIFVVYVPPGNRGPHMTGDRKFYKRTNTGNEIMSYQEIESSFLRYEERIAKVKLLYLTLIDMWIRCQDLTEYKDKDDWFTLTNLDTASLLPIMSDVYSLLSGDQGLPGQLISIKREADTLSTKIQLFHLENNLPLSNAKNRALEHNRTTAEAAMRIQKLLDQSLDVLEGLFEFRREKLNETGSAGFKLEGI